MEEFKAPLLNVDSAVYQEGLRLVSLETKFLPCGFQAELQKCNLMGMCGYIRHVYIYCVFKSVIILLILNGVFDDISVIVTSIFVDYFVTSHGPLDRYVKLRVAHAPGMPGTFFPATDFKGNR